MLAPEILSTIDNPAIAQLLRQFLSIPRSQRSTVIQALPAQDAAALETLAVAYRSQRATSTGRTFSARKLQHCFA